MPVAPSVHALGLVCHRSRCISAGLVAAQQWRKRLFPTNGRQKRSADELSGCVAAFAAKQHSIVAGLLGINEHAEESLSHYSVIGKQQCVPLHQSLQFY
jgi:hypothetical protein